METKSGTLFDKINQNIKTSVTIKLLSIGILIAIMLIPNSMIKSLIRERKINNAQAVEEVSEKWGAPQTLTGPVLTIPFERVHVEDDKVYKTRHYAHFLPTQLNIDGELNPVIRKRGIYEVVVYNTTLQFNGNFDEVDFSDFKTEPQHIIWDEAFVSIGIPGMSGIQEDIKLQWGKEEYRLGPGIPSTDVIQSGVHTKIGVDPETQSYAFVFDLNLNGTGKVLFSPVGKTTRVKLHSTWPHPSFTGQFLPDNHQVTEKGFDAEWSVFDLNRNFPQRWVDAAYQIHYSGFGVDLYQPVDNYQKNIRSAKYAVLILFLTFITFFFIEILNKKRIHPVQYILVGLALTVFYTLLLSLSEHVGFDSAYVIASIVIIAMITLYSGAIFKSRKLALIMQGFFLLIYGFIYVILQLQDFSLLVGSFGLVIVIGVCMYLSRKVDWYNIRSKDKISHA